MHAHMICLFVSFTRQLPQFDAKDAALYKQQVRQREEHRAKQRLQAKAEAGNNKDSDDSGSTKIEL